MHMPPAVTTFTNPATATTYRLVVTGETWRVTKVWNDDGRLHLAHLRGYVAVAPPMPPLWRNLSPAMVERPTEQQIQRQHSRRWCCSTSNAPPTCSSPSPARPRRSTRMAVAASAREAPSCAGSAMPRCSALRWSVEAWPRRGGPADSSLPARSQHGWLRRWRTGTNRSAAMPLIPCIAWVCAWASLLGQSGVAGRGRLRTFAKN